MIIRLALAFSLVCGVWPEASSAALKCEPLLANDGGFTPHFQEFLDSKGFENSEAKWSSFGGKPLNRTKLKSIPTIFIHGNSDSALGHSKGDGQFDGWREYLKTFSKAGLGPAELYGLSWGDGDPSLAKYESHDWQNVSRIREFIESVLEYTGAKQVNIVAHSMGVTLALKAILGGRVYDGSVFAPRRLGEPLNRFVNTFVGIAGALGGLSACVIFPHIPTCSDISGFHPDSSILRSIREFEEPLASRVISIWSESDEIIGANNRGKNPTSRLPFQESEIVQDLDHFSLKNQNAKLILELLYRR